MPEKLNAGMHRGRFARTERQTWIKHQLDAAGTVLVVLPPDSSIGDTLPAKCWRDVTPRNKTALKLRRRVMVGTQSQPSEM